MRWQYISLAHNSGISEKLLNFEHFLKEESYDLKELMLSEILKLILLSFQMYK